MYADQVSKCALAVLALAALALAPAAASGAERNPAAAKQNRAAEKLRLESFGSCTGLIRYGRRYAKRGPGAGPGAPFAEDFSAEPPPLLRSPDGGPIPQPHGTGGRGCHRRR